MRSSSVVLAALLLAPLSLHAQLARDTARAAAVVVTATRSPLAASRTPASVTVVTGDALRAEGVTSVTDALRRVPGLAVVQTGGPGAATSLFIRGGESKFAKVLVDGVPVNDAGGSFDFSTLSTDNIDRIEIVRGPASVLYGSDAMAGVVQLFTRRGEAALHGDVSTRGGADDSWDSDASLRGGSATLDYSIAGAQHSTRGIQLFNSGFRQRVGSAFISSRGSLGDAQLSFRYTDDALHYPTDGAGQVVDSNAVRRADRLSVGAELGRSLGARAAVRLALASYDVHGITDDQPDSRGDSAGYYFTTADRSHRRSGDLRFDVNASSSALITVGVRVEREWQASHTESNFGPNQFDATRRTTGLYSQLLLTPSDGATLTLGARSEHNEQFGDFFTWRAAGSAQLATHTRLRASAGTAFREPSFLESFGGGYVIGNPALHPERALSGDFGVEQDIAGIATLSATWFASAFRDLIDYKYSPTQPNYLNVARTRTAGAELEGRVTLPVRLHADASLTYLATRVVDPGTSAAATAAFAPGARLLRRPMHTIDAGVGYRDALLGIDLRAHHVGTRQDDFFAPDFSSSRVTLHPYTRADLSADVSPLSSRAGRGRPTFTLRIENLFDAHYSEVAGVNADFAHTDDASINATGYRAPGRRAFIGLRLTL